MAKTIHNQKIQSSTKSFAGQFGHRENALLTSNFTLLAADEASEVKALDGITHVNIDTTAGTLPLVIPAANQAKGRMIRVRKTVAGNTLNITAKDGSNVGPTATLAVTAAGSIELFSTGAAWVQV